MCLKPHKKFMYTHSVKRIHLSRVWRTFRVATAFGAMKERNNIKIIQFCARKFVP